MSPAAESGYFLLNNRFALFGSFWALAPALGSGLTHLQQLVHNSMSRFSQHPYFRRVERVGEQAVLSVRLLFRDMVVD